MRKKIDKAHLSPIPWRDFVIGFQIAADVLEAETMSELPDVDLIEPDSDKALRSKAALKNDPYLRVLIAIRNHFGTDYSHLNSFIIRYWALIGLVRQGHISDWITSDEDGFQNFHPAVLLAASESKLTNTAKFPPRRFCQSVETIINEESEHTNNAN